MYEIVISEGGTLPAPLDVESATFDNELVEGFLSSQLCSLTGGKLDEGTLLPLNDGGGPDLPKLVEMVPVWRHAVTARLPHPTIVNIQQSTRDKMSYASFGVKCTTLIPEQTLT